MIRKLFALLLLLTGLAALGQPAQARIFDVESTRSVADAGFACAVQRGARLAQRTVPSQRDKVRPSGCRRPSRIVLIVPTIMLQADRARE